MKTLSAIGDAILVAALAVAEYAPRIAIILWQMPWAALWWVFYLWPAEKLGYIERDVRAGPDVQVFRVINDNNWHSRAWREWNGLACSGAIVLNTDSELTRFHELWHIKQRRVLGILFEPVYGLCWLFYGYTRHPLETHARDHAAADWAWYVRGLNDMQRGQK